MYSSRSALLRCGGSWDNIEDVLSSVASRGIDPSAFGILVLCQEQESPIMAFFVI